MSSPATPVVCHGIVCCALVLSLIININIMNKFKDVSLGILTMCITIPLILFALYVMQWLAYWSLYHIYTIPFKLMGYDY